MAEKTKQPEETQARKEPVVKVKRRRYWPWSLCPCGSGQRFRHCCGATGAKDCRYEKE